MGNARRKAIISRLREEGERAYRAGTKRCHNPHSFMDASHWMDGWDMAQLDDADVEADTRMTTEQHIDRLEAEKRKAEDLLMRAFVQLKRSDPTERELQDDITAFFSNYPGADSNG